ncbi:MAG: GNAT family N-acetyltransferase [Polyangiaceae bacterium]|nr:GNAT family N-acetyltransferase [Polyangiaceae bacterium]
MDASACVPLADRAAIAARLEVDRATHLYELGDLDDFFFPECRYFGHPRGDATALVYGGSEPPTLLALGRAPTPELVELVRALAPALPDTVYAHLVPGLAAELAGSFAVEPAGLHRRLVLGAPVAPDDACVAACERLGPEDRARVEAFYRASYPGSWFVPRMLETRRYFGLSEAGALVAVAGVHVYAPSRGVAALGNVATRPDRRGRGLGRVVCVRLLADLAPEIDTIGLNVAADNAPALALYRSLGFEPVCDYEELWLRRPAPGHSSSMGRG